MIPLDTPQLLAIAAALGWASGLRLYAVLFLTGIAGYFGWVALPSGLHVLQSPVMLGASGLMLFVEFFADKIPGVDTLWDLLHTVVRIPAGAALAAAVFGADQSSWAMAAALLGGTLAATSHVAKATTRAALNASPEPFSNIAMSLLGDSVVPVSLWLSWAHPYAFFGALAAQVAFLRCRRPDVHRLVARQHVLRIRVDVRIDGDRRDAELARRGRNAAGDFAAIGDQDLLEHVVSAAQSPAHAARAMRFDFVAALLRGWSLRLAIRIFLNTRSPHVDGCAVPSNQPDTRRISRRRNFASIHVTTIITTSAIESAPKNTYGCAHESHKLAGTTLSPSRDIAMFENGSGEAFSAARVVAFATWLVAASVPPSSAAAIAQLD